MKQRWPWMVTGFAVMAGVAGCDPGSATTPSLEPVRAVGVLETRSGPSSDAGPQPPTQNPPANEDGFLRPASPLEMPDSVARGEPFTALVTTIGDPCTRSDGAEVTYAARTAEVTAYDVRTGEMCALVAVFLQREVTLRFDTTGEAIVRLIGRRLENGKEHPDRVIIERSVVVH